ENPYPARYAIDPATCLFDECAKCVEACQYGAIDLHMQPQTVELRAGAVIVATGWRPYDARAITNLAFGHHPDVITNVMMERMAAETGPTGGRIVRPSDGEPVRSVAFIQCAGSRDRLHLGYCSSICCLASLKEASLVLATGMAPSLGDGPPTGVDIDEEGFVVEGTDTEGILVAGCARAPVDVATTTVDATAAAMRAIALVRRTPVGA